MQARVRKNASRESPCPDSGCAVPLNRRRYLSAIWPREQWHREDSAYRLLRNERSPYQPEAIRSWMEPIRLADGLCAERCPRVPHPFRFLDRWMRGPNEDCSLGIDGAFDRVAAGQSASPGWADSQVFCDGIRLRSVALPVEKK